MSTPETGIPPQENTEQTPRSEVETMWTALVSPIRAKISSVLNQQDIKIRSTYDAATDRVIRSAFAVDPNARIRPDVDMHVVTQIVYEELLHYVPESVPENVFIRRSQKGRLMLVQRRFYGRKLMHSDVGMGIEGLGLLHPEGRIRTYDDIGKEFGVTRQRAEQATRTVEKFLTRNARIRSTVLIPQER